MLLYIRTTLNSIREEISVNGYELWLVCEFLKKNGKRLPSLMNQALSQLNDLVIT